VGWRQWPCAQSSRHVGQPWRPWANLGRGGHGYSWRNSAACTHMGGAVFQERRTRVWGPPVRLCRTLGRVARSAEHGAVADVEGCAAGGERHDVIGGQVASLMSVAPVARAPVAVLAAMPRDHPRAKTLPCPGVVEGVVPAAVRQSSVHGAAATRSACDDTADRAELHGPARLSRKVHVLTLVTLVTLDCSPSTSASVPSRPEAEVSRGPSILTPQQRLKKPLPSVVSPPES